jgi:hypothetical protein
MLDKNSYINRVANRLEIQAGVAIERPHYALKSTPPHESSLCEGCKGVFVGRRSILASDCVSLRSHVCPGSGRLGQSAFETAGRWSCAVTRLMRAGQDEGVYSKSESEFENVKSAINSRSSATSFKGCLQASSRSHCGEGQ